MFSALIGSDACLGWYYQQLVAKPRHLSQLGDYIFYAVLSVWGNRGIIRP
jgi:hypothetical protein